MKINKLIILLISIILICIGAVLITYYTQIIKHVDYKDMDVKVGMVVGINIDTDAMHFGIVRPRGIARHKLNITNIFDYNSQIIISWKGNISHMISVSDNNFALEPGEIRVVTFSCTIPENAPINATYEGRARVMFKKI
jgi:hypothetical protein